MTPTQQPDLTAQLGAFRADGWAVAVHNDYRLNGQPHTFWLFTKGNQCVKGEGRTDTDALAQVLAAIGSAPATAEQQIGQWEPEEPAGLRWKAGIVRGSFPAGTAIYVRSATLVQPVPTSAAASSTEPVTQEMIEAGARAAREHYHRTGGNDPEVIYRAMRAVALAQPQPVWTEAMVDQAKTLADNLADVPPCDAKSQSSTGSGKS